jgi:hydrogenase maturation protein HypF
VTALRVRVTGVVQGVGFRPFVHRLALRHGLVGAVRNSGGDVRIDVQGPAPALDAFVAALTAEAPPLARIERVTTTPLAPLGSAAFVILESEDQPDRRQPPPVAPDVALCAACERELFDPSNRRYRYPFITCTDCGPRFTVINAMPYDRERTSMRAFTQCADCLREYHAPGDRRYHSESNSCPACGPRVWLEAGLGVRGSGLDGGLGPRASGLGQFRAPSPEPQAPISTAAQMLIEGKIIAIRGLGGFHLAVDATNEAAVRRLRARKHRETKPLAVMVRTVDEARAVADIDHAEEALLVSRERPIVLLRCADLVPLPPGRRPGGNGTRSRSVGAQHAASLHLAPSVSPGLDTVGLMLAYTPLHHLLLAAVGRPLVMTSGNRSDEPIAISNDDARTRLAGIADTFLLHDREIVARYDDSVLRVTGGGPVFLRRARGFAPLPLDLPFDSPAPLVAVGPHLKNTFTLVHGRRAFTSQHIGDLGSLETVDHFHAALAAYRRLFRIDPEVAARDLHPEYLSTRVAAELGLECIIPVQHHHAHIAAVLAEHGETGPVIGVAYDGTGYGDDGRTWGGEILVADLGGYRRTAHLRYAPMPGGDLAARHPWRAAAAYLSLYPDLARAFARAFDGIPAATVALVQQQIAANLNAPPASSMGRLFDAAAAVLGVRRHAHYEGQAAMELEALAARRAAQPLPFPVGRNGHGDARWILDPLPLLTALGDRATAGVSIPQLAAEFHESVAAATAEAVARVAQETGLDTVVLGGGVFQNARLLESITERVAALGLRALVPRRLSPNDGAVSYGQAAVAAARLLSEGRG